MEMPVYDIEVPRTSNFRLLSGPFVHNSKDLSDSLCGAVWAAKKSMATMMSNMTVDSYEEALNAQLRGGNSYERLMRSSQVKLWK
jgi:hypothetical protein